MLWQALSFIIHAISTAGQVWLILAIPLDYVPKDQLTIPYSPDVDPYHSGSWFRQAYLKVVYIVSRPDPRKIEENTVLGNMHAMQLGVLGVMLFLRSVIVLLSSLHAFGRHIKIPEMGHCGYLKSIAVRVRKRQLTKHAFQSTIELLRMVGFLIVIIMANKGVGSAGVMQVILLFMAVALNQEPSWSFYSLASSYGNCTLKGNISEV